MNLRPIAFATLLMAATAPAAAQQYSVETPGSQPGWTLERTMSAFLLHANEPRGFFPTRGDWAWVVTTHYTDRPDHVGIQRFRAEDADRAIAPGGPLCPTFNRQVVDPSSITGSPRNGPWRRVGTRFVPPGRGAGSPVFVEWRREDGRWVVSSFGEEEVYYPPSEAPGTVHRVGVRAGPRGEALRLPLADSVRVAGGAEWFERKQPIVVAGYRLVMYGLPRTLGDGDVVRWGIFDGIPIYVEPMNLKSRAPDAVYLPIDRAGMFQPYQNTAENPCAR